MVLQQQANVPIWGEDKAGKKVTVVTSWDNKKYTTTTTAEGKWKVKVTTPGAGGPYSITINDGKTVRLNNVLIGEVWLCSGQSNMELPVSSVSSRDTDLAQADSRPLLHFFNMPAIYATNAVKWSATACDSVNRHQYLRLGPWQKCSRESLKGFSAVAYHFGAALADSLKVPVGIICNAVGGTTTESWIDRHTLEWDFPLILRDWYRGEQEPLAAPPLRTCLYV